MAAILQSRGVASFGKRFAGQIQFPITLRRLHSSLYDKNPEETSHSVVVPDHVMPPQNEEYWAPHPKTGVFGPAADDNSGSGVQLASAAANSVLGEKVFFRAQENLEKPPVQP